MLCIGVQNPTNNQSSTPKGQASHSNNMHKIKIIPYFPSILVSCGLNTCLIQQASLTESLMANNLKEMQAIPEVAYH